MTGRTYLLLLGYAAAAFLLASCSLFRPDVQIPKEVRVPVAVPCIEAGKAPKRPALRSESDLLAMDTYRRTLAAWADLKRWEAYGAELEALVEGCSRIPVSRPP